MRWYRRAAEQDLAAAQVNLAYCHEHGRGVAKDEAAALMWYRRAAEHGHPQAQLRVGIAYFHGQSLDRDPIEAHKWLTLSGEPASKQWLVALEKTMGPTQLRRAELMAQSWRRDFEARSESAGG